MCERTLLAAIANKLQCAILAPTEVLAEQHYLTLSNFLRESSVTVELLTNRTKKASRKTLQKHVADGLERRRRHLVERVLGRVPVAHRGVRVIEVDDVDGRDADLHEMQVVVFDRRGLVEKVP